MDFGNVLQMLVRADAERRLRSVTNDGGVGVPMGGAPAGGRMAPFVDTERMFYPDPDPADFGPQTYTPATPTLTPESSAYRSRWDRVLPLLGEQLSGLRIPTTMPNGQQFALAAIRGLAAGLGQRLQGEIEQRLRAVRDANASERERVREVNTEGRAEAASNRADLRSARRDAAAGRREFWRTAAKPPSVSEMTPEQQAEREARLQRARRARGVHVPGDTTPAPKDAKFSPTSWHYLSDADKLTIDELDKPIKDFESGRSEIEKNAVLAGALAAPPRNTDGTLKREHTSVTAARKHLAELESAANAARAERRSVFVDAAIAHLASLPESADGRKYVIDQVRRMARRFQFADDPDFKEAIDLVDPPKRSK